MPILFPYMPYLLVESACDTFMYIRRGRESARKNSSALRRPGIGLPRRGGGCHDWAMRIARLAAAFLLAASLPPLQALTLKMATLAPEGSPWVEELRQVAWQWERVSGGRVRLKIYAGGVAGEEPDMLRKLRIGQLQGAALTQLGLGELEPDILTISVPFLVRDEGELDLLLEAGSEPLRRDVRRPGLRAGGPAQGGVGAFLRPAGRGPAR